MELVKCGASHPIEECECVCLVNRELESAQQQFEAENTQLTALRDAFLWLEQNAREDLHHFGLAATWPTRGFQLSNAHCSEFGLHIYSDRVEQSYAELKKCLLRLETWRVEALRSARLNAEREAKEAAELFAQVASRERAREEERVANIRARKLRITFACIALGLTVVAWKSITRYAHGHFAASGRDALAKGEVELAVSRFTKALWFRSDDVQTYAFRAEAYRRRGDNNHALEDLNQLIRLKPTHAAAYHSRGCVFYDIAAWNDALRDFQMACELRYKYQDYSRFRIWLLRSRKGEDFGATHELRMYLSNRTSVKGPDWAGSIGKFLAGQISEGAFFSEAESLKRELQPINTICESFFYAGAKRLIDGDPFMAKEYFEAAIKTRSIQQCEYRSAISHWRNLSQK